MTIAVVVKVNDGYVLASDSATTVGASTPAGVAIANIYNNANKIFNLRKGLPVSAMTYNLGNIGPASISTLAKDLRMRFAGKSSAHEDWKLKRGEYTMQQVVDRFKEFFWDEHYKPFSDAAAANGEDTPLLGLIVGGYGADEDQPELFEFQLTPQGCNGPLPVLQDDTGASWWAQGEAITRLLKGVSGFTPQALLNLSLATDEAAAISMAEDIAGQVNVQIVSPAMPIQDAVDLAEFLVRLTIGFVRFCPGHPTVGGPIEIAAVTKHEGFQWVQRKHYFDKGLNPVTGRAR
ncbi:hypothetical protein CIW49_18630 [Mycolicibacterium sp. P1-18]|uniref:hypothetical protein n=1 Tax=Mycolicibacterium sp. P1-18 TaxID=2024615 RepID=UPI0011F1B42E|nr:hypothetical protein [Mycolicibacterium sp. P1-18]KAA0096687.1 hypothetical protein CIW49_18630 [Mycolicibacterium sp. P1-18]